MLLMAFALMAPAAALAASETNTTSGYNQEPNKPKEETSPSKEKTSPTKEAATPTAEKSLPFTGFDLRWSLAIGIVLIAAGVSIVAVQRRQRG
jgi:hypothetical protein